VSTWQVYGVRGWGSTLVEGALSWCGIPYDFIDVEGFDRPGPARDRLLKLNPLARVPTLVAPDGEVLTESAAITLILAERHPESGLAPTVDDPTRAAFLVRLVWFVSALYPTFTYRDYPERWAARDQDGLKANVEEFQRTLWSQFEEQVGDGPWVLGERPSALDLFLAAFSYWSPRRPWLAEHCPRLHAIAVRADALPQLAPVIARNFHE
jgi:GST-like protein